MNRVSRENEREKQTMLEKSITGPLKRVVLGALAAGTIALPAAAEELRFVHAYPVASQHHRNVEWFTQQVTERTKGEVTFRVFPSAQIMPINQELPGILSGQVAMTYSVAPVVASVEPLWGVFDLPFAFDVELDDMSHAAKFFASEKGGGVLAASMEKRGFKLITIAPTDYPSSIYLTKNKAPEKLEDVKGLKIRIAGGRIAQLVGEAYGYSPVAIAGAELVPALSQGVVDGGILPPIYTYDNKLPLKGLMVAPQAWPAITPIIMSLSVFNSLSPENQKIMMEVGAEMTGRALKIVEDNASKALDDLKAGGADVVFLSPEEEARWSDLGQPAWEAFVKDNGPEAQTMLDELARLRDAK